MNPFYEAESLEHRAVRKTPPSMFHVGRSMFDVFFKKGGLSILFLTSPLAQAILDTNQNGASDLWERHYNNGNLSTNFLPSADPDGDGWTNAQEAAAGTDPAAANHPTGFLRPEITHYPAVYGSPPSQGAPPSLITPEITSIEWPTLAGKQYIVFTSTDLSTGSWRQLGEPRIGSGSILETNITLTQQNGSVPEKLFLRVSINDVDSDDDGLTDYEEGELGTNSNSSDSDDDGLTDKKEAEIGTNPNNSDTDGDGTSDGDEVEGDTDPQDGNDFPVEMITMARGTLGGDGLDEPPGVQASGHSIWRYLSDGERDSDEYYSYNSPHTLTRMLDDLSNITYPELPEINTNPFFKSKTLIAASRYFNQVIDDFSQDGHEDHEVELNQSAIWISAPPSTVECKRRFLKISESTMYNTYTNEYDETLKEEKIEVITITTAPNKRYSERYDLTFPVDMTYEELGIYDQDIVTRLLPVDIDDNIIATGVDDLSNTAAASDTGYQEKLWIMAPSGNDPNGAPCSNEMKFKIPLWNPMELEITCSHATPTPGTVTLDPAGATCAWHGISATTTESPAVTWKMGAVGKPKTEVDLPIVVKTMKRRTVKVAVYPVRCKAGNRAVPMPERAALENWLNQVFAYQVNAWFQVVYKTQSDYDYDTNNDTIAPIFTSLIPMIQSANFQDASQDIRIFIIDSVSLRDLRPNDPDLNGYAIRSPPVAVVNAGLPGIPARPLQQVMETIAHEVGHVMLGEGHPDENTGDAPLLGTDRSQRLMCTFVNRAPGSKLLVKSEWDEAEEWLKNRTNGDN